MATLSGNVSPEWLDEKFVERALREGEADPDIVVKQIQVKAATAVGDNYGSKMYRVSAEFVRGGGKTDTQSLIVKAPPGEGMIKEMSISASYFVKESNMYAKILPEMEKLLVKVFKSTYRPFSAKAFYVVPEPAEILVMEDLAPAGFKVAAKQQGLDLDQCKLVMQRLAMFHAASVVLAEKDPSLMIPYHNDFLASIIDQKSFFINKIPRLAAEVKTWPEYSEKYAQKLLKYSETFFEDVVEKRKRVEGDFNVLNHADAWTNNLMFKYSETGQVIDLRLVDYQLSYYGTPTIDLYFVLTTSCNDYVKLNHHEDLLLEYHSTLSDTLNKLKYSGKVPSYVELKQEVTKKEALGVFLTFCWLPEVLADPNARIHTFSNKFKAEIKRVLPIFDKKGLLNP